MNYKNRLTCGVLVFSFLASDSWAVDSNAELICKETSINCKKVENTSAYKAHAILKSKAIGNEEATIEEVWLECRGEKIHATIKPLDSSKALDSEFKSSSTPPDDYSRLFVFDGKRTIRHEPLKFHVYIEPSERLKGPNALKCLVPRSWTNFSHKPEAVKYSYYYVLREKLAEAKVESIDGQKRIKVTLTTPGPDSVVYTHSMLLDTEKNVVVGSAYFGGNILPHQGEFEWKTNGKDLFVSKGKISTGPSIGYEWTIDSFTTDARQVRASFSIDESKLPVGTRIEEVLGGSRTNRFIGGDKGKKEHDLQVEALLLRNEKSK